MNFFPRSVKARIWATYRSYESLQLHCNEARALGCCETGMFQAAGYFQSNIRNTYDQTVFSFIHNFQCLITKVQVVPRSCEKALLRHLTNQSQMKIIMTKICAGADFQDVSFISVSEKALIFWKTGAQPVLSTTDVLAQVHTNQYDIANLGSKYCCC